MTKKVSLAVLIILVAATALTLLVPSNKESPSSMPKQVYSHQMMDLLSDKFAELDKNHDHFLNKQEIAGTIFDGPDFDENTRISIVEFIQRAEEIFAAHDKDGNNILEAEEIAALMGLHVPEEKL